MFGKDNPKGVPEYFFSGALSINYSTAKRADVAKQNYTVCPRYWYIDATFACRECGEEFDFPADEQRFWYEDKQFYVDSKPRRCPKCRKDARTRLELRKRYDAEISRALGQCAVEMKKELVEVIDQLEAVEGQIPEQMGRNRTSLRAQLAKDS